MKLVYPPPPTQNLITAIFVLRHIMHGIADTPGVIAGLPPAREGHPVRARKAVWSLTMTAVASSPRTAFIAVSRFLVKTEA